MTASIAKILGRQESHPVDPRALAQFSLGPVETAGDEIVLGPNWSLYCLDTAERLAVFVELPEGLDLAEAPFVYAAQFQHAQRVATVPFDALPTLAACVLAVKNLAILMSTGRCGSTLASRIFAQIPGVWSLSEPDWFTNLAFARAELGDAPLQELIAACIRLTCRPPAGLSPDTIVLKPRSEMIVQAPSYVAALPEARAVFLYRDCVGYVNSLYRFAQRILGTTELPRGSPEWGMVFNMSTIASPDTILKTYFEADETIGGLELMTLGWLLRMQAYLRASDGGMRVEPLHYDDLTADRRAQTTRLMESCGIDARHLEVALHGFDKDAHSGSAGENTIAAEPLTPDQKERVRALVARWGFSDYASDRLAPLGA